MSNSYNNIFPQTQIQSPSLATLNPPPPEAYQSLINLNKLKLKNIEAQYFQNEYQKIQQQKSRHKQSQLLQKQKQRFLVSQKHQAYQSEIQRMREKKQMQRDYLSSDYQQTIDYHNSKSRYEKKLNEVIDKQLVNSMSWIRDPLLDRESRLQKQSYYNQALDEHLRVKQQRAYQMRESQVAEKQKLHRQAEALLQKQYEQLQNKHRVIFCIIQQKSLFQQRQNQILGVQSRMVEIPGSHERQNKLTQRQLYRQGLQAQYEKQQNQKYSRKKAVSVGNKEENVRYNPITNPIPYVYKNPNVLRMLNQ